MRVLLQRNAQAIALQDAWTQLMMAASRGDPEIIELLLDHGAEIDHESPQGWTALIVALRTNQAGPV